MEISLERAICEAELQNMYDSLTDEVKQLHIVNKYMHDVEDLIDTVRIAGFTKHSEHVIRACEGFDAFSSLGIDKTIQYKSTESLGEAAWKGLVKFYEFIKSIIVKVGEFLGKIIGTTTAKAKEILANRSTYNPANTGNVSLPTLEAFAELNYVFEAMAKICNKYLYNMEGALSKGLVGIFEDAELKQMVDPNGRIKMEEDGNINLGHFLTWYYSTFTGDKNAAEHEYGAAVVFKICNDYLSQARSFSMFGAKINKAANAVVYKITTSKSIIEHYYDASKTDKDGYIQESTSKRDWTPEELKEERKAYIAYTSLYRCCAKLQKEKARLINEFYRAVRA